LPRRVGTIGLARKGWIKAGWGRSTPELGVGGLAYHLRLQALGWKPRNKIKPFLLCVGWEATQSD